MPELEFVVESAEAIRYAVSPSINFALRIDNVTAAEQIANVALQCQIQIEAPRRRYNPAEREQLRELFGDPGSSGYAPRPLLWTHVGLLVPGFQGTCVVDLPVPCSYDFNVAATKFFYALEDDAVPLLFQFSGTVFYRSETAGLQIDRIAWSKEARFPLPVPVWQRMMDHYYPNSAWLCLDRGRFDRLCRYKRQRGFSSWEQALESLLDETEEKLP